MFVAHQLLVESIGPCVSFKKEKKRKPKFPFVRCISLSKKVTFPPCASPVQEKRKIPGTNHLVWYFSFLVFFLRFKWSGLCLFYFRGLFSLFVESATELSKAIGNELNLILQLLNSTNECGIPACIKPARCGCCACCLSIA